MARLRNPPEPPLMSQADLAPARLNRPRVTVQPARGSAWAEYTATTCTKSPPAAGRQGAGAYVPEDCRRIQRGRAQEGVIRTASTHTRTGGYEQTGFRGNLERALSDSRRSNAEVPAGVPGGAASDGKTFTEACHETAPRQRDPILKRDHDDAFVPPERCGLNCPEPGDYFRRDYDCIPAEDKARRQQRQQAKYGRRYEYEDRVLATYAKEEQEELAREARHLNGYRKQYEAYIASLGQN